MMVIVWAVLGVVLVVMVLGGFVARARTRQRGEDDVVEHATHHHQDDRHHPGHHGHGKDASPSRGKRSRDHHR